MHSLEKGFRRQFCFNGKSGGRHLANMANTQTEARSPTKAESRI